MLVNSNNKQRKGAQNIPRSQKKQNKVKKQQQHQQHKAKTIYCQAPTVTGDDAACIMEFAIARSNPFHRLNNLPCNPVADPGYSTRRKIYLRATVSTGSDGNGFFVCNPFKGYDPVDGHFAYSSSSTSSGSGIDSTAPGVTNWSPQFTYKHTDIAACKIVGLGVRVTPAGKLYDTSGMLYQIVTPSNNQTIKLTAGQIAGSPMFPWVAVKHGRDHQVVFRTRDQIDNQFIDASDNASRRWGLGFYWAGCEPKYPFEIEVVGYYEYKFDDVVKAGATPTPTILEAKSVDSRIAAYVEDAGIDARSATNHIISKFAEGALGVAGNYASSWFKSQGYHVPKALTPPTISRVQEL